MINSLKLFILFSRCTRVLFATNIQYFFFTFFQVPLISIYGQQDVDASLGVFSSCFELLHTVKSTKIQAIIKMYFHFNFCNLSILHLLLRWFSTCVLLFCYFCSQTHKQQVKHVMWIHFFVLFVYVYFYLLVSIYISCK